MYMDDFAFLINTRHQKDRSEHLVVGLTTTCVISALLAHGEVYSILLYVIKFVSDWQVVFVRHSCFFHQ